MPKIKHLSLVLLMILCSGCASINSTNMTSLSSAYREVIEQYSNENILLNVVRASQNMPMSFLDIPSIIGTGNVVADARLNAKLPSQNASSIPGFFSPGPGSETSASVGLTVNSGFTFTQSSLDNSEFMKSFLKTIPVGLVGFKGTQQLLPRALSYTLLIESIELQNDKNVVRRFQNDPADPDYEKFQEFLYVLIEAGLTVETQKTSVPIGPPLTKAELANIYEKFAPSLLIGNAAGGAVIDRTSGSQPATYQLSRIEEKTKLCINKFRAQQMLGELLSEAAFCNDSPRYQRTNNFVDVINNFTKEFPQQKDMRLAITLRSTGNIFDFLGRVVRIQLDQNNPKIITLMPTNGVLDHYNKRYYKELPLFKIYKNASLQKTVSSISYKGDTYQIQDEDESYTKHVLEFMSALLSASKIPGAIPVSPSVIVR